MREITFSHGGNWNKQGGRHFDVASGPLIKVPFLYFDLAARYFEEILLDLNQKGGKSW